MSGFLSPDRLKEAKVNGNVDEASRDRTAAYGGAPRMNGNGRVPTEVGHPAVQTGVRALERQADHFSQALVDSYRNEILGRPISLEIRDLTHKALIDVLILLGEQ